MPWQRGRRVFLLFEAVGSAFHCWINGEFVGYSQDSCLPAEFDVTAVLRPGTNVVAVQVCPAARAQQPGARPLALRSTVLPMK